MIDVSKYVILACFPPQVPCHVATGKHNVNLVGNTMDIFRKFKTVLLLALFLQSILYGVYLYTCFHAASSIFLVYDRSSHSRWRSPREISWTFLVAGTLLFLNTSACVAMQLYGCMAVFVYKEDLTTLAHHNHWIIMLKVHV